MKLNAIKHWFLSLNLKSKLIFVFVVFVAVIAFLGVLRPKNRDSFDVYTVKRGEISETITNSGNANTSGNASVYSPSTGIIESVFVNNGDVVVQGQELMKVKSTATEIEKSVALASYQAAQSALDTSKQAKISNQSLLEAGRKTVIDASIAMEQMNTRRNTGGNNPSTNKQYTQDEIESILSAYQSAKKSFESLESKFLDSDRAIEAAQSSATSKWLSYQATLNGVVKSPIGGTVTNLSVAPGDSVIAFLSSDLTTTEVRPLLRISTLDNISVRVKLNEIDITKVHASQSATVVFDALPEKVYQATVSRVDSVGTNNNAVVTYDAFVHVSDMDPRIKPGMTATVTIQTDIKNDALIVPNIGLNKNDNNETIVQLMEGKSSVPRVVQIGMKNSSMSEVLSGLSEGDKVIIPKTK